MIMAGASNGPSVEYLSDLRGRFASVAIGWGVLGINTCVHLPDRTPLPLRIRDKIYDRGLGAHAPGHILIDLDGEYETFEAEVGVQWQGQNIGSVVFQVFVDGEKRFDSGVMREADEPKRVRVSVRGAQELALVMTDAGDGITCDCANWVEARLTRAGRPAAAPPAEYLDAAPFARVVTCDPARTTGARAGRTEEFLAEDVFLEIDVPRRREGSWEVPTYGAGIGCVGLWWMEPRRLRELGVEFSSPAPPTEGVRVEYWAGETAWQGQWVAVAGSIRADGNKWTLAVDRGANPGFAAGTRKIRWIIPSAEGVVVRRLWALSRARLKTSGLVVQVDRPQRGRRAEVEAYNGLIAVGSAPFRTRCTWDLGKPLRLRVKHTCPTFLAAPDRTLVLLRLPEGGFGVAVQDALRGDGVYVRDYGVLITRDPAPLTPAEYRHRIAGRKSVLDVVHERPDQTFDAAMAAVHRPIQDNGPTMLSLACHNAKYIVEREGTVRFGAFSVRPKYGSGSLNGLRRFLDGGWLPAPVVTVENGGLIYRQRPFVAPVDDEHPAHAPEWLRDRAVCVAEIEVENPTGEALSASVDLAFLADTEAGRPATVALDGLSAEIRDDDRLLAVVDAAAAGDLRLESRAEGGLSLRGDIAPGDRVRCAVFIPSWRAAVSDHLRFRDSLALFADFAAYWRSVVADAMQVDIPEPLLANVIRASQVHCLIAARNEDDGRRIEPWIAANTYGPLESEAHSIIYGMDLMGHHDFSRRALDYFIHRYNPAGYLTTGYTIMGTGWHLWTLAEHVRLADDREWLRAHADEIARVCDWIVRQRHKTMRLGPDGQKLPEYGLMPPGVMADWNAYGYFVFFNSQFCAGLRDAAEALAAVGHPRAEEFRREASEFRAEILRAYSWMQERAPALPLRDGTWVPSYPSLLYCPGLTAEFFPGADGGRVWANNVEIGAHHLIATGLLAPTCPQADWIVRYMEDAPFLADGFGEYPSAESERDPFNLGGFAKLQPYYCRIAEVHALRDDVKAFVRAYFNALPSLLNTENLSLWEHFHNMGAWNKTHETGWFLVQTHRMFVAERGDELWLAPFVAQAWMKDGSTVAVERAPSSFGPVSYRIRSQVARGYIEAHVNPPGRATPGTIVLRLRHPAGKPIRSVTVNGAAWQDFDPSREIVRLPANRGALEVRATY